MMVIIIIIIIIIMLIIFKKKKRIETANDQNDYIVHTSLMLQVTNITV